MVMKASSDCQLRILNDKHCYLLYTVIILVHTIPNICLHLPRFSKYHNYIYFRVHIKGRDHLLLSLLCKQMYILRIQSGVHGCIHLGCAKPHRSYLHNPCNVLKLKNLF